MKYIDPRFVILIFGYVLFSEFLRLWLASAPLARALAAFTIMLLIYRFPSKMKTDFINWMGGSSLAALAIFLGGGEFAIAFSILLLAVFFLAYFRK